MKQQELQELQEYIEELKRHAEEQVSEYYWIGYKNACEIILEKIERLEKNDES